MFIAKTIKRYKQPKMWIQFSQNGRNEKYVEKKANES